MNYKFELLLLAEVGILIDIFFKNLVADSVILILTGFWILSARLNKLKAKISIWNGLIFMIPCPFLLVAKQNLLAEKIAIWAYILLTVGISQEILFKVKARWLKKH